MSYEFLMAKRMARHHGDEHAVGMNDTIPAVTAPGGIATIQPVAVPPVYLSNTPAQTTTFEPWDSVSAVQQRLTGAPFTIPLSGTLDIVAQSDALVSVQKWDRRYNLSIEGTVRAQPAAGSKTTNYWGSIALSGDATDDDYVSLATQRNITPTNNPNCNVVSLAQQDKVYDNHIFFGDDTPWVTHVFRMEWVADQQKVYYYVDKVLVRTIAHAFTGDINVRLLCVSVPVNTPDDGSKSHAQWGPITVTGVRV